MLQQPLFYCTLLVCMSISGYDRLPQHLLQEHAYDTHMCISCWLCCQDNHIGTAKLQRAHMAQLTPPSHSSHMNITPDCNAVSANVKQEPHKVLPVHLRQYSCACSYQICWHAAAGMHATSCTWLWLQQYRPESMDTPTICAEGHPNPCCCCSVLHHCCVQQLEHQPPLLAMSQQGGLLALLCARLYVTQSAASPRPVSVRGAA